MTTDGAPKAGFQRRKLGVLDPRSRGGFVDLCCQGRGGGLTSDPPIPLPILSSEGKFVENLMLIVETDNFYLCIVLFVVCT